ncbi:MAG: S49 family peptidase [Bauldia sp.]|nr:S49 family peptidase [Bauldia sp.]
MAFFLRRFMPARFRNDGPTIPVLRLAGTIGIGSPFRPGISMEGLAVPIRAAFAVKDAPAVALVINSPGGAATQSHLIFKRLRALADEKEKKLLAFIEDVGASGGYMIALAADEIFADPASIVGSIGVVSGGFGFDRAIERLGIERRLYSAGERKVMLDPFSPENPRDVEHLRDIQRDIHALFIDLVRSRRGERLKETPETFSGMVWSGPKAKEAGLIDGIGDVRSELRARYGDKVKLKPVTAERGLFRRRKAVGVSAGLAAAQVDAILGAIEERALWGRFGL